MLPNQETIRTNGGNGSYVRSSNPVLVARVDADTHNIVVDHQQVFGHRERSIHRGTQDNRC